LRAVIVGLFANEKEEDSALNDTRIAGLISIAVD